MPTTVSSEPPISGGPSGVTVREIIELIARIVEAHAAEPEVSRHSEITSRLGELAANALST
jgi:hypothetical protein